MNLDELDSFLAVVEHGSIQAAASALRISRATLRRRLADLEAQAGVPLLVHGHAGAQPTEAGRTLAERGRGLALEAGAMRAAARHAHQTRGGLLRVVAPVGMPPAILAMIAAVVRARLPELAFQLDFHPDPAACPLDEIDLAFHFGPCPPLGQWRTSVLLRMPEQAIATRAYLAEHGTPATVEDLAKHALFSWRAPGEDGTIWPTRGGGVAVRPVLVSPDVHLIRQCALLGLGIALVPDGGFPDPGVDPDEVVVVLPEVLGREGAFRLLIPEALAEVPRMRAVLAVLREQLGAF